MRLGYFGGSFDPPHRAHWRVAELARRHFGLHRVLLAPTGRQPLKSAGAEASFADRLRMVELLCKGHPGLEASAIDSPRPAGEANYTVDTLRRLRSSLAAPTGPQVPTGSRNPNFPVIPQIFAIVGADAFLSLRHWREPAELLRLAQWIVVSRPGFALETGTLGLTPTERSAVHLLPGLDDLLSATALRSRLHAGEDCRKEIPARVRTYLEAENLYHG